MVSGWRYSVDLALAEETKKGAGGDVVALSTEPFSAPLLEAVKSFPHSFTSEMYTVAVAPKNQDRTLFSKLKAVESAYPVYGEVPLKSGRQIHEALKEGLVVESRVLERLEIEVGDQLKIGNRVFSISDMALSEPDRPMGMWGVSPRIFINFENLEATGLVHGGSYLERRIHLKLEDPAEAESVADNLRQRAIPDQERVDTWERPPVSMEKYINNFFTFLDMMAVLSVALGGLGLQSTLSTWFRARTKTVAITRTLGANTRFVMAHYTLIVFLSGIVGYLLGLFLAAILLVYSGDYLSQVLPVQVAPTLSWFAAAETAALCSLSSLAFIAWPLYKLSRIRPMAVLRKESSKAPKLAKFLFASFLLFCLNTLLFFLVKEPGKALKISMGLFVVCLLTSLMSGLVVAYLKSRKPKLLTLRTALGSWRSPEAQSELIVFVLSTCLTILFTAVILEKALEQSWIEAMPADSPNILFLDIQPDQLEGFTETVQVPVSVYPNLRVRVLKINGELLDRSEKRKYWDRDGRGKMDALPSLILPSNDELLQGESLYTEGETEQVSIRQDIAELLKIELGDRVTFGIQGVPLEASVSSIRKSHRKGFKPSFEFLFPPNLVEGAPRTIFASARLANKEIGPLQVKLAKAFPGIVSMDLSLTIRLIAERLNQMVRLVKFFLWSGLLAGALILVSATWSARQRRSRESAFYKLVGASMPFLRQVVYLESLALGVCCSGLGLALATLTSWGLCKWTLRVPFPQMLTSLVLMLLLPTIAISLLNWLMSRKVLETKPITYLKEN